MHIGKRIFCFIIALFLVVNYFDAPSFSESVNISLEIRRNPISDGDKTGKIDISVLIYGVSEEDLKNAVIKISLIDGAEANYTDFTNIQRSGPYKSTNSALPFYIFETRSIDLPFDSNYKLELCSVVDGEKYVLTEEFDVGPISDIAQGIEIIGNPIDNLMEDGFIKISWKPATDVSYYKLYFCNSINELEYPKNEWYIEGDKTSISIDPLEFLKRSSDTFYFFIVAYKGSNNRICRSQMYKLTMPLDYPVHFKDPDLEGAIREAVKKEDGGILLLSCVKNISILDASNKSINDIGGIQYLSGLTNLKLNENSISDISALCELTTKLKSLDLSGNQVTSIADLGCLTGLNILNLSNNNIKEIGPLSSLKSLQALSIDRNQIEDISALKLLINLKYLILLGNNITDFSPVAAYYNNLIIKDFILNTNPIATRPASPTPAVTDTMVSNTPTPTPTNTMIPDTPTPVPTDTMIPNTPTVSITTATPTPHKSDPSYEPSVIPAYTETPIPQVTPSNTPLYKFTDDNLKKLMEKTVGKTMENITRGDLERITILDASGLDLTSLEGIQNLCNLASLELDSYYSDTGELLYNHISDLSPLRNLSYLQNLILVGNNVSDVSPLSGLTNLNNLDLGTNYIKDITPLSSLVKLKNLSLFSNDNITDIRPLSNMKELVYLDLGYNAIEDISCLSNLENLEILYLDNNNVKDDNPLKGLKKLKIIGLDNNPVTNYTGPGATQTPAPTPLVSGNIIIPIGNMTPNPYLTPTPTSKSKITPTPTGKTMTNIPDRKLPSTYGFKDIDGHWARDNIARLIEKGIISGYPDGTVRPDLEISRAEIVVMLAKAVNLKPSGSTVLNFADGKDIQAWASGYVKAAVENKIINGYEDNTFRPSARLLRRDMTVMAIRAFGYTEAIEKSLGFKDSENIPEWAKAYIAKAVELGIVNGYKDNTFRPDNSITRAEAFTIISKCLK